MSHLIDHLQSFDRKERSVVLQNVLNYESNSVDLSKAFAESIQVALDGDPIVPTRVMLGIDYHLDWIELALLCTSDPGISMRRPFKHPTAQQINANQQDIDILIAFDALVNGNKLTYLIMIEAKAFTGWNNEQLRSKAERLRAIFGDEDGLNYSGIALPRFILMSPKESERVEHAQWPSWMKPQGTPLWMVFDLPVRVQATRCEHDGKRSAKGQYLRLDSVSSNR